MRPRQSSLGIEKTKSGGTSLRSFNEAEAIKPRNLPVRASDAL